MRFRVRSKVDLPQPDGPISAVTLLVATSSDDVVQSVVLAVIEIQLGDLHAQRSLGRRSGIGTVVSAAS